MDGLGSLRHIDGTDEIINVDLTRIIAQSWSGSNSPCSSGLHMVIWLLPSVSCSSWFYRKIIPWYPSVGLKLFKAHLSLKLRALLPLSQGRETDALFGAHPLYPLAVCRFWVWLTDPIPMHLPTSGLLYASFLSPTSFIAQWTFCWPKEAFLFPDLTWTKLEFIMGFNYAGKLKCGKP